jgi:hypothetical protein
MLALLTIGVQSEMNLPSAALYQPSRPVPAQVLVSAAIVGTGWWTVQLADSSAAVAG